MKGHSTMIEIISIEMIKPSSPNILHFKPYKLNRFDQIIPSTQVPLLLFYPATTITTFPQNASHLKTSLSKALNHFYHLAGKIQHNLFITGFDAGVPFIEAKVHSPMAEFLHLVNTDSLNEFFPCLSSNIAFQASQFTCGGMAMAITFSHKLSDGTTMRLLLKYWAAIASESSGEIVEPDLFEASSFFPPRDPLPEARVDASMFKEVENQVTRRFVFSDDAIDRLRAYAKSETLPNPTRIETLTGLIWKHIMKALGMVAGSPKSCFIVQAVNMRHQINPSLLQATGNLLCLASTAAAPVAEETELRRLVGMVHEAIVEAKKKYEGGFDEASDCHFNELKTIIDSRKAEGYVFTSWTHLFKDVDFGWGEPFWISPKGKFESCVDFMNKTVFVETKWSCGIEAWINLDKKIMDVLEQDSDFLAFASLNPPF